MEVVETITDKAVIFRMIFFFNISFHSSDQHQAVTRGLAAGPTGCTIPAHSGWVVMTH